MVRSKFWRQNGHGKSIEARKIRTSGNPISQEKSLEIRMLKRKQLIPGLSAYINSENQSLSQEKSLKKRMVMRKKLEDTTIRRKVWNRHSQEKSLDVGMAKRKG